MADTGTRYGWTDAQKAEMRRLYEQEDWSMAEIAAHLGCTSRTVAYHLHSMRATVRPPGMQTARAKAKYSGPLHHSWAGGRIRDHGYIRILRPEHPQANRDGYVAEHRFVMEQHLRVTRPEHPALLAEGGIDRHRWHVHHINGQKDDNRLANLQVLPRERHSPWMHYKAELVRLKELLAENGIEA
jgi:hypothetical protein